MNLSQNMLLGSSGPPSEKATLMKKKLIQNYGGITSTMRLIVAYLTVWIVNRFVCLFCFGFFLLCFVYFCLGCLYYFLAVNTFFFIFDKLFKFCFFLSFSHFLLGKSFPIFLSSVFTKYFNKTNQFVYLVLHQRATAKHNPLVSFKGK